jgi:hypothetical protein
VQSVSAVVHGTHLGRDFGVTQRCVEIDDTVKHAALPDPGIDRDPVHLAHGVPGVGHVGLIAERCQRRANDLDAGGVGAQRYLLQASNHMFGGDLLLGLRPPITQIIGAEHDNDVCDARLRQHVAVEPPEPVVAADVVQDAVAA